MYVKMFAKTRDAERCTSDQYRQEMKKKKLQKERKTTGATRVRESKRQYGNEIAEQL